MLGELVRNGGYNDHAAHDRQLRRVAIPSPYREACVRRVDCKHSGAAELDLFRYADGAADVSKQQVDGGDVGNPLHRCSSSNGFDGAPKPMNQFTDPNNTTNFVGNAQDATLWIRSTRSSRIMKPSPTSSSLPEVDATSFNPYEGTRMVLDGAHLGHRPWLPPCSSCGTTTHSQQQCAAMQALVHSPISTQLVKHAKLGIMRNWQYFDGQE